MAATSISTAAASSQTPPPQASFTTKFGIAPELVQGIDISSFQDTDGSTFEGIVMRDPDAQKKLIMWTERTVSLSDRVMTPESHIREEQGQDVLGYIRNRLVEERPKSARGAEGRSQPPTMDDVAVCVKQARAKADCPAGFALAASAAAAAAMADFDDSDPDDNDGQVHFVEQAEVAGISLAASAAGQASLRPQARKQKRQRPGSSGLSAAPRGSRAREVERLDGSSSTAPGISSAEDVQVELDKLCIYDILMNSKHGPKICQSTMQCGSQQCTFLLHTSFLNYRMLDTVYMLLRTTLVATSQCCPTNVQPVATTAQHHRHFRKERFTSTRSLTTGIQQCSSESTF